MTQYVAFLRAVNVGGRVVSMERLRALFHSLGFSGIQTYIQTGNVLFQSEAIEGALLRTGIEQALRSALGYDVGAFLRTRAELQQLMDDNPFRAWEGHTELKLYVTFLSDQLKMKPVLPMLSGTGDLEVFAIRRRDILTVSRPIKGRYGFPNNFIEEVLRVKATTRNWQTVRKMLQRFSAGA